MSDLITKETVIDMLEDINAETEGVGFYFEHWVEYIKQLPSAEPQIIRCKDCKHLIDHRCYHWRSLSDWRSDDDYCSYAERRKEE